jgi:hypothetical protein
MKNFKNKMCPHQKHKLHQQNVTLLKNISHVFSVLGRGDSLKVFIEIRSYETVEVFLCTLNVTYIRFY